MGRFGSLRWKKSFIAKASEWSLTGNGKKSISKAFVVFLDQYYDERVSMCTVHTIVERDDSGRNGKFITKLNDAVKMSIALQSFFLFVFVFLPRMLLLLFPIGNRQFFIASFRKRVSFVSCTRRT